MMLEGKRILITGGTGSLGQMIVRRLINQPVQITIFSRDEAKQHDMKIRYGRALAFFIGNVRDYPSVLQAMQNADIVFHAAALKQVPTCEYFPYQAVLTNVIGAQNIVRAIQSGLTPVELVVSVSTDKACEPINVMGMTKALQERIFIRANVEYPATRFVCVRYGNVIASRGSVVPLFKEQIANGGPVTITSKDMTRFFLTLPQAVNTIFAAVRHAQPGEIYVPKVGAGRITDLADIMIDGRDIPIKFTGIRPGEKIHETIISKEESRRTIERDGYYVIRPMLYELQIASPGTVLEGAITSANITLGKAELRELL
jgi:UDP-glucose 4-epimerase